MRFHRAPGHSQLFGDFGVVASLQQQLCDLFFSRPKPNRFVFHASLFLPWFPFRSLKHDLDILVQGYWREVKVVDVVLAVIRC